MCTYIYVYIKQQMPCQAAKSLRQRLKKAVQARRRPVAIASTSTITSAITIAMTATIAVPVAISITSNYYHDYYYYYYCYYYYYYYLWKKKAVPVRRSDKPQSKEATDERFILRWLWKGFVISSNVSFFRVLISTWCKPYTTNTLCCCFWRRTEASCLQEHPPP